MRRYNLAILILVILFGAGCGLSNTMYNARNYFKAAQARPLNSNGRPSPQAVEEYTKTIQKCGIIISERKSGKQVEEALFLMSQALYFKGNSAFQAKDQFENLIRLFPESEYIPDANIFLAKIYREINQPAEAESRLEAFIRDNKFRDYHPKALLTLADFEILDKDYLRAEFWLQRIITDYPDSKESYEAYFLMGKNLYVQKLYEQSNRQLEQLVDIRKASKELKLEARYYIALNQLALGSLDEGLDTISGVIKNEVRADKLSLARVQKARLLAASGNNEAAQQEFDAIMRDYPRTPSSSAAAYFLGDYQFFKRGDRAAATASYNRVRTESATGEYVSRAQAKVTALQQLGQGANLNSENNLQQFLDYHYLAADNYERVMEAPDSSFVLYQRVIDERGKLASLLDSVSVQLDSLLTRRDSLQTHLAQTALDDSLRMAAWADSSRLIQADTLNIAISDSLEVPADSTAVVPDSLSRPQPTDTAELQRLLGNLASDIQAKQNRISNINLSLARFDTEIIPFVKFVKASLHMKLGQKDPQVADILSQMQTDYPGNKYTNGIRLLYNGQRVRIIDPRIEEAEAKLDWALGLYPAQPDSMVTALTDLLETESEEIKLKSRFRLAWHYAIERADTTSALPYLQTILESQNTGKYGDWSRRLFDGTNFLIFREAAVVDTISEEIIGELQGAEADSSAWVEIPVFEDSLAVEPIETEEPLPELPEQIEEPVEALSDQALDLLDEQEPTPQEPLEEEAPLE